MLTYLNTIGKKTNMNNDQLNALKAIHENNPEYVKEKAKVHKIREEAALGILAFVVANEDNYKKMTKNQEQVFDKTIRPLIEKVKCEGMVEGNCQGTGYIPEEELENAYNFENFECSTCSGTRENWFANNP